MIWTDARIEQLKSFWANGWSAAEIAGYFRDVTRNAVLGKICRLGLQKSKRGAKNISAERSEQLRKAALRSRRRTIGGCNPCRIKALPEPVETLPSVVKTPLRIFDGNGRLQAKWSARALSAGDASRQILLLGRHDCRWPIGDPSDIGFHFCREPAGSSRPYCDAHHAMAHDRQSGSKGGSERLKVECGNCGWHSRRKPGKIVYCPKCGAPAAYQPQ